MEKLQTIPKGTLFIMSEGAYSDYSVRCLCRATADIDADALRAEFLTAHPQNTERYRFNSSQFIAWVAAKGLFEELPFGEFYLGDYGDAGEMRVTPDGSASAPSEENT